MFPLTTARLPYRFRCRTQSRAAPHLKRYSPQSLRWRSSTPSPTRARGCGRHAASSACLSAGRPDRLSRKYPASTPRHQRNYSRIYHSVFLFFVLSKLHENRIGQYSPGKPNFGLHLKNFDRRRLPSTRPAASRSPSAPPPQLLARIRGDAYSSAPEIRASVRVSAARVRQQHGFYMSSSFRTMSAFQLQQHNSRENLLTQPIASPVYM